MSGVIESLRKRAAADQRRIIFPESQDPRVVAAADEFLKQEYGVPVLISNSPIGGHEVISANDEMRLNACAAQLAENRKHKGLSVDEARDLVRSDPLLFGSLLVRIGVVDGSVAGSIAATAAVIRAGLYGIGTRPGRKLVSSFFLMELADRALTYADCGVVPDPDADQLAEIAVSAAENHQLLTGEVAKVAMLSFSTLGSAEHPRVEKVREATRRVRELAPELAVDGELQFDAAFVESVAERKAPESPVAGKANVFVFPDLDSGNIAYKITERLAGATALGPLVQGLARPSMDLSRGCSASDIVDVAVIASVLAGSGVGD